MKRRSVQRAYQNICPDEEVKDRMLRNILLSSEISPAGKDEQTMRRKMKPMVVAALIGLMVVLMGCAVVIFGLQDLKIGVTSTYGYGEILNSEGNVLVEKELMADVISLHGFINSPTYLAHQEWFDFYEDYSANHVITEEENFYIPPEAYEAYTAYNQELMDKIDEIVEKYGLKLLGSFAPFQEWESDVFYEATGLNGLLASDSSAVINDESGYFYEGGNFKVDFHMSMPDGKDNWPYEMLNTMYYSKSDYFDTVYSLIKAPQDWEQWNYITSSGAKILIAKEKSGIGAKVFHNRDDVIIYLSIECRYENTDGEAIVMSNRQLEQVAEQFDYSLKVECINMDLAREKLGKFNNTSQGKESSTEYTGCIGYAAYIQARIDHLRDEASEEYYCLSDIDHDGMDDLIVGSVEEIEYVWMMKFGQMIRIMEYGENYKKLKEDWPTMEKKPITEYPVESSYQDKYGYLRLIGSGLLLEHPDEFFYVLADIDGNGTMDLLLGGEEQCGQVWSAEYNKYGNLSIKLLSWSFTEEEWNALNADWLNMEKKPITAYFSE